MAISDPILHLRDALGRPLPGLAGQMRMAPSHRPVVGPGAGCSETYREAAVIALLYPCEADWCIVLTRRTENLASHQGQISFPGGRIEAGETAEGTALRELEEELAVDPSSITILGQITPLHIVPSRFYVHPIVAFTQVHPHFQAAAAEVSEVIEAPLRLLLDPETQRSEVWQLRGQPTEVPFYAIGSHKVWGATAMILAELLALLNSSTLGAR